MAGRPVFPGDAAKAAGGGARATAGNGDASALRNTLQSFVSAHDGDARFDEACGLARQLMSALKDTSAPSDRGATPGRNAASKVQQGTAPPLREGLMARMGA